MRERYNIPYIPYQVTAYKLNVAHTLTILLHFRIKMEAFTRRDAGTTCTRQHSAARLIRNLTKRDSVLPVMMELHWLPLRFRITFKLCVLMHGVHYGLGPKYLTQMVVPISSLPGRERLRSAGSLNYDICRTRLKFTEHSFAASGPTARNSLPLELKQINNSLKFKKLLKSHLFLLAYSKLF